MGAPSLVSEAGNKGVVAERGLAGNVPDSLLILGLFLLLLNLYSG